MKIIKEMFDKKLYRYNLCIESENASQLSQHIDFIILKHNAKGLDTFFLNSTDKKYAIFFATISDYKSILKELKLIQDLEIEELKVGHYG